MGVGAPAAGRRVYGRLARNFLLLNVQRFLPVLWSVREVPSSPCAKMDFDMAQHPLAGDLQTINRIALFRGLKPETVEHIIAPATVMTLKAHETVCRQGNAARAFFIVIDGWTKHYRINVSGEETVIHLFTRGDSFAEAAALTGGSFPATAEAITDARIVRVPADHMVRCIRQDPDIALAIIASTSYRLHNLMQQIEQLKAQSGVQRVAEFLAARAPVDSGSCVITLPYDKVLIAARLGLTPESLSRTFAKLKSIGVAVHAEHVAVSDVAKLHRLAAVERSTIRGAFSDVRRHV